MKQKLTAAVIAMLLMSEAVPAVHAAETVQRYEAENALCIGTLAVADEEAASGGKVVGRFADADDVLTFTVEISETGTYDIAVCAKGIGSDKTNNLVVDGSYTGSFINSGDAYSEAIVRNVYMTEGSHEVSITESWGWINVDYITVTKTAGISDTVYEVDDKLINPDADENTRKLFSFLCDNYGKFTLSGQYASNGLESDELETIYEMTGDYPAILGLDMMDYCPSRVEKGAKSETVEKAIEYHEAGGIVTFCWHWNAPDKYIYPDVEGENPRWWSAFYTDDSSFDLAAVMDGSDPEGMALLDADIEAIAYQLGRLQEAGVPVLWRPLHEASGGWFWWGAAGEEPYKEMWIYLYDQLTNKYGLNNLIWVWNGQHADWYSGDAYVDMIGEDIYSGAHEYTSHNAKFAEILEWPDTNKIISLSENGIIYDIDQSVNTNALWSWFCTWNGSYITQNGEYSEEYTSREMMLKAYESEYVLTLSELPDIYADRIRGDVNADGNFSVADAVTMQKWLLAVPDASLADWRAGDLFEDEKIDVFDFCVMRQELISQSEKNYVDVSTVEELFISMRNAQPGDVIRVASGTYDFTTYQGAQKIDTSAEGTADAPIVLTAADPENPPVITGADEEQGYVIQITGDYWIVENLIITTAQKGIVLDNSNYSIIRNCEICNTGSEAVAIRDGSSYCLVKDSYIHDTGTVTPGYGEGIYIGSAKSTTGFDYKCDYNTVDGCTFKNVAAEHVDVKEYTTGTEIMNCTFYGDGMSGANYAGSFVDIAGNDVNVHDNVGYRNGNINIVAAFELHEQVEEWGYHCIFTDNTLYMDQPYGAVDTTRRMYVVDGWYSDFSVKNNQVDYGDGLLPADSWEYYNSDYVTYLN